MGERDSELARQDEGLVSPLLVGAAALVAGVGAAMIAWPQAAARWVALAQRGLAGRPEELWVRGSPAAGATMWGDATALLVIAVAPPLLAAWGAGWIAALAQSRGRARTSGREREIPRPPRRDRLGRALLLLLLAGAATAISLRREHDAIALARASTALLALPAALHIAARIILRVAVVLLAAGLVDHGLRRLRLAPARATRSDDQADPRLRAELRRRARRND